MSGFVFSLTIRQILKRRTSLIALGLAAIPLLVALIYRLSNPGDEPERWATLVLLITLVVSAVLPLTALLLGTSVLGDELEEGTAIYLLTKPLARWQILLPKIGAAATVTGSLALSAALVSYVMALQDQISLSLILGFSVAIAGGAVAYTSVFVLLSLITSRALITGLMYVFIWEATLTELFKGMRYLSIRHYALGIADWIANIPPSTYEVKVGGLMGLVLLIATIVVAGVWANRRLEQIEVREGA